MNQIYQWNVAYAPSQTYVVKKICQAQQRLTQSEQINVSYSSTSFYYKLNSIQSLSSVFKTNRGRFALRRGYSRTECNVCSAFWNNVLFNFMGQYGCSILFNLVRFFLLNHIIASKSSCRMTPAINKLSLESFEIKEYSYSIFIQLCYLTKK